MVCVPRRQLTEIVEKRTTLQKILARWSTLTGIEIPTGAPTAPTPPTVNNANNVVVRTEIDGDGEGEGADNLPREEGIFELSMPREALEEDFVTRRRKQSAANRAKKEKKKMGGAMTWWTGLAYKEDQFDEDDQTLVRFVWTKFPTYRQVGKVDHSQLPHIRRAVKTPVHAGGRRLFVGHEGDEPISLSEFDVEKDLKVDMFAIILYNELEENEKYGVGLVKAIRRPQNMVNVQWHVPKKEGVPPEQNGWKIWKRSFFEVPLATVQWATFMNKNKTFKLAEQTTVKHILHEINTTGRVDLRPGLIADPEDDDDEN